MPENFSIVSAMAGFEFETDRLKFNRLRLPHVEKKMRESFRFKGAASAVMPNIFTPPVISQYPSVAYTEGVFIDGSEAIKVKAVSFTPSFLIIDVEDAHSTCLQKIFEHLRELLDEEEPLIPDRFLSRYDHSDISVKLSMDQTELLPGWLRTIVSHNEDTFCSLTMDSLSAGERYPGDQFFSATQQWKLSSRVGSKTSEKVYFSSAPLTTEEHEAYLRRLEKQFLEWNEGSEKNAAGRSE